MLYYSNIGVILGLYRDNGKEHGNDIRPFRRWVHTGTVRSALSRGAGEKVWFQGLGFGVSPVLLSGTYTTTK